MYLKRKRWDNRPESHLLTSLEDYMAKYIRAQQDHSEDLKIETHRVVQE